MNFLSSFRSMVRPISGTAALVLSAVFLVSSVYAASSTERDLALVREYQGTIELKTQEIYELNENLDWLDRKIKRLASLHQPVPTGLFQSVSHKKLRISSLEKDVQNFEAALKKVTDRIPHEADIVTQDQAALIAKINQSEISDWFEVLPDKDPVQIRTTLPFLFPSGSAVVSKEYDAFLKKVASFVKGQKVWIVVDGYADPDPIKSKQFPSNFELGATRAANVVHAMVDKGVDPAVFKVASTGKYRFPDARPLSDKKSIERYINITILFESV
jgi:flagellar motor protein MotB